MMKQCYGLVYFLVAVTTAMVGHVIHHSVFWSVVDFFFWPLAWLKWLIYHQVCISVIKTAFAFFLK